MRHTPLFFCICHLSFVFLFMFVFVFGSRLLYLPGCAKLTHASPLPHFVFGQWHCVAIIFASLFVFLLKCALVFLLNYLSVFLFKSLFLLKYAFVFVGASCRVVLPPCPWHTLFFFCICRLYFYWFVFVFVAASCRVVLPPGRAELTHIKLSPPYCNQPNSVSVFVACIYHLYLSLVFVICHLYLSLVFVTCICHLSFVFVFVTCICICGISQARSHHRPSSSVSALFSDLKWEDQHVIWIRL